MPGTVRPGRSDDTQLFGRLLAVAAVSAAASGLGVLVVLLSGELIDAPAGGVIGGVLLVIAASAPTAWRLRRDGADAPGAYALATILLVGLTSLAWLGMPILPGPGLAQADIASALHLVALGLAAFGLGARTLGSARRRRPLSEPDGRFALSPTALSVCFAISIVTVAATVGIGAFGYISDPEAVARTASVGALLNVLGPALGGLVVLATALAYFSTRDPRLLRLLLLFTPLQMAIGFAGGGKTPTMLPLLYVLAAYCLVRRRVPIVPILVAAVFLLIFVVPANLNYREGVRGQDQAPESALRQVLSTAPRFDPATTFGDPLDYATFRFRSVDSIALIKKQTPSPFPYANGEKYLLLPAIVLVPRAIWQEKPNLDDQGEFTHTYWQAPTNVRSATQITQVGDLYRNFGTIGVPVGMLLWGVILAAATVAYHRWRSPRADLLYIFALLTVVVSVETYLPGLIATASKSIPFAILFAWLILPGRFSTPGYRRLLRSHPRRSTLGTGRQAA